MYGLLCSAAGCPVAVEVFCGNTGDPATVGDQVEKIQQRFGVDNVALVGDRGMITTTCIREDIESCGLEWISALKTTDIRKLLKKPEDGEAPLSPEALVPEKKRSAAKVPRYEAKTISPYVRGVVAIFEFSILKSSNS